MTNKERKRIEHENIDLQRDINDMALILQNAVLKSIKLLMLGGLGQKSNEITKKTNS